MLGIFSASADDTGKNSRFNERNGIESCTLGPDGPEMVKNGETMFLPDALVSDEQLLIDNGSTVAPTRICDRTDMHTDEDAFKMDAAMIPVSPNHICVLFNDGNLDVYLPDGEEFDMTAIIRNSELTDIDVEDGIVGKCSIEVDGQIQTAPIHTAAIALNY